MKEKNDSSLHNFTCKKKQVTMVIVVIIRLNLFIKSDTTVLTNAQSAPSVGFHLPSVQTSNSHFNRQAKSHGLIPNKFTSASYVPKPLYLQVETLVLTFPSQQKHQTPGSWFWEIGKHHQGGLRTWSGRTAAGLPHYCHS